MSFKNNLGIIRELGRNLILPVSMIKEIVKYTIFDTYTVDSAIDFGAGTLLWSKWLREYITNVIAVDTIYESVPPKDVAQVIYTANLQSAQPYLSGSSMLWLCDVIHHLPPDVWSNVKESLYGKCDFIVVKDIDVNYRFGNLMNRIHDRVINGEKIYNVNPKHLINELNQFGYNVEFREIHKLWYPHFLILARKKSLVEIRDRHYPQIPKRGDTNI